MSERPRLRSSGTAIVTLAIFMSGDNFQFSAPTARKGSLSHSVVVLAAILLPVLAFVHRSRTLRRLVLLGAAGVATHVVLDLFGSFTLFWPLLSQSLWVSMDLSLHIGSLPVVPGSVRLLAEPTAFQPFRFFDKEILTAWGLGVSGVLLIPSLVENLKPWMRRYT